MTEKKAGESRSVRRTRKALRDSLIGLLKTRSILRVGVKEICDAADVGRSTFYAHYKDQYALLREMEDAVLEDIEAFRREQLNKIIARPDTHDIKRAAEEMLDYIVRNGDFIQVLLSENGDPDFPKRFFKISVDRMLDTRVKNGTKPDDECLARYHALFLTGGLTTLIQWWLKNGMDTPLPEMTKLLTKLGQAALDSM